MLNPAGLLPHGLGLMSTLLLVTSCQTPQTDENAGRIKPWPENPKYWQYEGEPVLLVGASKDDNLFQVPDLKAHLDSLAAIGGNYIRNTMSSRADSGWEVYRFKQLDDGEYDLDQWNDEYWTRFENMLRWTHERDIIVQIEVWDRFDYSRDNWLTSPWNPANNINYTFAATGFAPDYPRHPSTDVQPFFHSIPGMEGYDTRYDVFRVYQEKFVDKLLSYSLEFPNVLYCMNNETSTSEKWGQYWMQYIRDKAADMGVEVYVTDMFDDFWRGEDSENVDLVFDNPDVYDFVDISQVNSRNFGQDHWDRLRWLHERARDNPRPLNNTKIYGGNESSWGSGTNDDGVERMWRHVLGGSASVRHHRPPSGCGLNEKAQASVKSIRKMETLVKAWELEPQMQRLSNHDDNEAYLAASNETVVVYFTNGGSVTVDLDDWNSDADISWISVASGDWGERQSIAATNELTLTAPSDGGWVAVLSF
jgi:hypothetical protein